MDFAVIPSFVLIGPLAVIAALFPGVFAKLAVQFRRWRALLTVASINSTLGLIYYWVRRYLPDSPWFAPGAVTLVILAFAAAGLVWSGLRYRRMAIVQPAITAPPTGREVGLLAVVALAVGLLLLATAYFVGRASMMALPWREFTTLFAGLTAALVYAGYRYLTRRVDGPSPTLWLSLSGETVALIAVFAATAMTVTVAPVPAARTEVELDAQAVERSKLVRIDVLRFDGADEVLSGLSGGGPWLYFGTIKQTGFRSTGAVWCVNPVDGKVRWRFDDNGGLRPVFSRPTGGGERVYVGEGLHTDADGRLFALDSLTGRPLWSKQTTSHTEGGAWFDKDRVVFAAGDDGLYCVDPDGNELWHVRGRENKLHIDTPPVASDNRVYVGSGYGRLALLAFDLATGKELWRTPVDLRAFSSPHFDFFGKVMYIGLGTGNLIDDLSTEPEDGVPKETDPAGAVVRVETTTGKILWRYDTPKSVHTELAVDGQCVYAACKDGVVYAIDKNTGRLRWRRHVGETFLAGPIYATFGEKTTGVYAVTAEGRIACLDPRTGVVQWSRELAGVTGGTVHVMSRPTVLAEGLVRILHVGAGLTSANTGAKQAAVFRITDVSE